MKLEKFKASQFDEFALMYNSYLVLVGKSTHEELLEKNNDCAFIFNPTRSYVPMKDDVYDILIEYFKHLEEYEICNELKEAKMMAKLLINFENF
tara:strand:+ start:4676 stop:4957 length:282 start_codon:yes stop_codon:yes gene_type:complete